MGDKLLLNSCAKFQRWIHMWNYGKIAKTMLRLYQMASRFQDSTNGDVRTFKDNKEYLNTPKRTNFINKDSSGYFRKKFWKFWIFNVCLKLFSTWSFRYEKVKTHDKRYCHPWHKQVIHWWNQEMISPAFCQNPYNFTRHHFFTHTNIITNLSVLWTHVLYQTAIILHWKLQITATFISSKHIQQQEEQS